MTTVYCDRCDRKRSIIVTRSDLGRISLVNDASSPTEPLAGVYFAVPLKPKRFLCVACLEAVAATPRPKLTPEADEKTFRGWLERVKQGLGPFSGPEDAGGFWPRGRPRREELCESSPRLALILEIADDVDHRFPIGIAVRLFFVISALAAGGEEDPSAILDLEDLVEHEVKARELAQKGGKP